MKKNKGFTLIELLVVIAIIGILASVVLAALSSARSKGQDAAIQSELSSMRAQAELYYGTTGSNTYLVSGATTAVTTCTSPNSIFDKTGTSASVNSLATLIAAIKTTTDCGADASSWSVAAQGATSTVFYCVDSTGVSRSTNAGGNPYTGLVGTDGTGAYYAHKTAGQTSCN